MRRLLHLRGGRIVAVLGAVLGVATGVAAVSVAGAVAQRAPGDAPVFVTATHFPPLLTLPGETVSLAYGVECVPTGAEDPEQACGVTGSAFGRAGQRGDFVAIPLEERDADGLRQLTARVPDAVAASADGFDYYAEIAPSAGGRTVLVPAGGANAPYHSTRMSGAIAVDLGTHRFGKTRPQSARVASATWGDGPFDVGLEQSRDVTPIGASSFDVDDTGTVTVLDQAHRRMLRWARGRVTPARVPLSIEGHLADMSVADDGSVYVLESVARPGHTPLVRRFDEYGRELDAVETAEQAPSALAMGPDGPVVLEHPSHQWMPVAAAGAPLSPVEQRRRGRSARPSRDGADVVVLRRGPDLRLALRGRNGVRRSWDVTSTTPLAEVQLAEPLPGQRLLVVVRAYTDTDDEFTVLILDRRGLAANFSVDALDWAESAPLGRFRLAGGLLYRLGSSPVGAFVDRFDLEVNG